MPTNQWVFGLKRKKTQMVSPQTGDTPAGRPPTDATGPPLSDLGYLACFFAFLDYQQYIAKKCARATFTTLDTSCWFVQSRAVNSIDFYSSLSSNSSSAF